MTKIPSTPSNALLKAWNALSEQLEREFGLTSIEVANIKAVADSIEELNATATNRDHEPDFSIGNPDTLPPYRYAPQRCTCYVLPHEDDCGIFVGITQAGERVMERRSGVDRRVGSRENCEHDWRFAEHAYEGDPDVPNGTRDFKVFVCEKCGEEENRAS